MNRQSSIALVVVRLRIGSQDCLLLQRHHKWGDWSLIGGHVEPDEEADWHRTAVREADEELALLREGTDFVVDRQPRLGITWGPAPSRSAQGIPTEYTVQFFGLRFLADPIALLPRPPRLEFAVVPLETLASAHGPGLPVAEPVQRLLAVPSGLAGLALSWPTEIASEHLHVSLVWPPTPMRASG